MCRLTDGPLFAVLSYLSGGRGDALGVAVTLLPVAEQRPVQLQVTPWPEADAAFELETSWRRLEALRDSWMNSENPGTLQRKCSILEKFFFHFRRICCEMCYLLSHVE